MGKGHAGADGHVGPSRGEEVYRPIGARTETRSPDVANAATALDVMLRMLAGGPCEAVRSIMAAVADRRVGCDIGYLGSAGHARASQRVLPDPAAHDRARVPR